MGGAMTMRPPPAHLDPAVAAALREREMNHKGYVSANAPKKIKKIQFQPMTPQQIVNISEFEAYRQELYELKGNGSKAPQTNGVLDPRMGTSDKSGTCETCHMSMAECVGHYAYIKLVLPVYHIGYFRACITMLQDICKTCSRVLLSEEDRRKYLRLFRRPGLENLQRASLAKQVNTACRKVLKCPYCTSLNGVVKKAGPLKITHERFRQKSTRDELEEFKKGFAGAIKEQRELSGLLSKAHEDIHPLRCLDLFRKVSAEDCELLGLKPDIGRPEDYIWQYISVPSPCIRPSVAQEAATNEDDLTVKLSEIIYANQLINASLAKGQGVQQIMEQWEWLQLSIALYINADTPGIPKDGNKPIRGFCQRLKGKQGRFRGNLSGKRVDFSGRTVIGPDPNLRIDEVAVPRRIAKKLTYPERVTDYNIERLKKAVLNGTTQHPGANYVIDGQRGFKKFLRFAKLDEVSKYLRVGDTVERHLIDGDIVLFNRQPSLHKLSIMCHRVKVRPWRTLRLNECACNPYNADFDGDEMNMHVPQTEEARTEALELMNVKKNMVTPKNGEPIIAAIQDFITASYLLSKRDTLYDRQQFTQICSYLGDANLKIDLPPPVIQKPVMMWTGKQVYNCLMRPNKESKVLVNLEAKCKTLVKSTLGFKDDMSPNDGYLVIVNSEVMCGVFDKATVGDGKKNSVFGVIFRDYGPDEAAIAMGRLAKLSARWLANQGFSLGINDVMPGPQLRALKEAKVEDAYAKCDENINLARQGKLQNQPGCDQEETLEHIISGLLSGVRADVGNICMAELSRFNAPLIMATCGSKGSLINVAQMVACVGQQIIAGKRVQNGFVDRSLPHFPKKSRAPGSKGFVRNSFFSGLTPTEFLCHAISGREGLVDTAVKTAETGYMSRRLMKALEDLSAHYDISVRNSVGGVVQFTYGDDGLDPACLEGDAVPVAYTRSLSHVLASQPDKGKEGLLPYRIREVAQSIINGPEWSENTHLSFREATLQFIEQSIIKVLADVREHLGIHRADDDYGPDSDIDAEVLNGGGDPGKFRVVDNVMRVTETQLRTFLEICYDKYYRALIEPGSTVGAVGAQSIGEPGTQMTLKTFHFAGVAAMNVTLGVPRIKEIINAAKIISTPIITCKLQVPESEPSARIVKGRVEKTLLGDIASVIEEAWGDVATSIGIHIDHRALSRLQLECTLDDIKRCIVENRKLKISEADIVLKPRQWRLRIYVDGGDKYHRLRFLKRSLPSIVVNGLPQIARALISIEEDKAAKTSAAKVLKQQLLVEGYGLKEVMCIEGIVGTQTRTNHVMETQKVLGIEAARRTIFTEIQTTMESHGMNIDPRHIGILSDTMTYKGEVLGITRFGVQKSRDSTLMLASFEKTTDHLFDAALYSKEDAIEGVSECIILGTPAKKTGTAIASLVTSPPVIVQPKKPLFERLYKAIRARPA
ncbi:DNA-directed RNA polymerase III subunit C1 (rpo31) [Naganishia albida]|nr:DNA-directed RNA polymerase III subunit C1 (rpo31) [Naganishia albida]